MKRFALLCLMSLALPVGAADSPAADAGLAEIMDLGRLNGQALACSQAENAARIKQVMIKYAPKSRRYGALFEQATNEAFLAQTREQAPCQDGPALASQVENVTQRLQAAFPASAPQ